jgi:molybdopterin-guanine dinucleotide biosynthesis protein A
MGVDKATLVIDGEPLARRVGRLLAEVARPALEVGPGSSELARASVSDPAEGPLTAIVAGWLSLKELGHAGAVIVLATDLPWLTHEVLGWLATAGHSSSVVPVVAGEPQPLCARWCQADLERAARLAASGERAARVALGPDAAYLDEAAWAAVARSQAFSDVDRPEDLERHNP